MIPSTVVKIILVIIVVFVLLAIFVPLIWEAIEPILNATIKG
jgi:hypothetical protein